MKAFIVFDVDTTSLSEFESEQYRTLSSSENDEISDSGDDIELAQSLQSFNPDGQERKVYIPQVHFRCCSYTLNEITNKDIQSLLNDTSTSLGNMHAGVIENCNELWNLSGCPKSAELNQNFLEQKLSSQSLTR